MKQCNINCTYIDIVSYIINDDNDIEIYLNRDGIVNLIISCSFDPGIFENKVN